MFGSMTKKDELWTQRRCDKNCTFHGHACRPILNKKLLVGTRLCKNLNWNSISLVLFVHFLAKRQAAVQFMFSFIGRLQSSSHFFGLDFGAKLLLLISFL